MTHRQIMERLIAALAGRLCSKDEIDTIAAAREYLEAPEQEPVSVGNAFFISNSDSPSMEAHIFREDLVKDGDLLYIHPAPEPVNQTLLNALTHAVEIAEAKRPGTWDDLLPYRAIIAAAEQAPAADECTSTGRCVRSGLYCPTAQPAELTDEEILAAQGAKP